MPGPRRSALINVMAGAALKAAKGLIRDFGEVEQLQVSLKGPANFVSAADHRAEEILLGELSRARPGYGFLMEERGDVAGADRTHRWIVDPLDGTTNFLHGIPYYCVSIALRIGDVTAVGVVFDPTSGRLFTAIRGQGALLDGVPIQVSGRPGLSEAVVGTGLPFKDWHYLDDYLASLREIMQRCAGIRRPGAAALDLAYVAAGWTDGHWEKGLNPWDVGAGSLLVVGSPGVHAALLAVLKRYPALAQ
jgi:myo-inositol-1(or 4)-monophosphatase